MTMDEKVLAALSGDLLHYAENQLSQVANFKKRVEELEAELAAADGKRATEVQARESAAQARHDSLDRRWRQAHDEARADWQQRHADQAEAHGRARAALHGRLAGTRKDYRVPVNAVQQVALEVEAAGHKPPGPAAYLLDFVTGHLTALVAKHAVRIAEAVVVRCDELSDDDRVTVLGLLGVPQVAAIPAAEQAPVLRALAVPRLMALDSKTQNEVFTALGL